MDLLRPPFDPELGALLPMIIEAMPTLTPKTIGDLRRTMAATETREQVHQLGLATSDVTIAGPDGNDLIVTVASRPDHTGTGPGIYHTHGGGMIVGSQLSGLPTIAPWILEHDAVVVSVDYRLAPEHPHPAPAEDCYAGLVWMHEHAGELGIDPARILVAGASAGGGLAAAVALMARDRQGPPLIGQMLICPMLDDRDATVSTRQFNDAPATWDRAANRVGWEALLGDDARGNTVSAYAAPARATDLAGLPPTYIDCGSAEVFRDEDVAYATALWAAGVAAELHIWAGGFHGFDMVAPHAEVSRQAVSTRNAWVARLLG